jgi:hypothetical protein
VRKQVPPSLGSYAITLRMIPARLGGGSLCPAWGSRAWWQPHDVSQDKRSPRGFSWGL